MRNLRLSVKLPLLIVIAATLTVIAVIIPEVYILTGSITSTENEANTRSLRDYASAIEFYLADARTTIEITALDKGLTDAVSGDGRTAVPVEHYGRAHIVARTILEHSYVFQYVMLLDADGSIAALEPVEFTDKLLRKDLTNTAWYKKLVSSGQTVISDLSISPVTQRPSVVVATPVFDSAGAMTGIWAGGLNLGKLSQLGSATLDANLMQRYGFITDSRGLIIAHQAIPNYVADQTDFSSTPPVRAALSGQQGVMRFVSTIDGIEKLAAYSQLPGTNWAVAYVVPVSVAFEPINRLTLYLAGLGLLMIILMGLAALLISQQVTLPIEKLAAAATKVGAGDLGQRVRVESSDEIGQLGTTFNTMAISLQATIQERDRAEAAKLRAEGIVTATRTARDMIENMSDPVILAGPDGRIVGFNQATTDLWGYGEELIGTPPTILVVEREASTVFGVIKDALEKGYARNVQHTALTKDKREVPILLSVVMLKDSEGNPINIVAVIRDISELKQKEAALNESLERFRVASGAVSDLVWEWDISSGKLEWYGDIDAKLGYNQGEFPRTIEAWGKLIHPDDYARVDEILTRHIERNEPYSAEYRIIRKDGGLLYWYDSGTALRDDNGKPRKMIGAVSDVTARKLAEVQLNEALVELQRSNSELEQFAYVASHDMQEPLRMVSSYVQLLEKRYKGKLDEDAHDYINFAVDGARRMQSLINDLLEFSRVGTRGQPLKPIASTDILNSALHNLEMSISESGAVIAHGKLPLIIGDEGQMVQVFQNLIGNAIKFHSHEPPKIDVRADRKGDEWIFSVKDNGIGIDPQFFDRIFIVFQRLHRGEYSGTGIGLSVVKKIVQRHGGRVWLESQPGKGSTFYFAIPDRDKGGI
jgi:PAS domain S-box-containing protein